MAASTLSSLLTPMTPAYNNFDLSGQNELGQYQGPIGGYAEFAAPGGQYDVPQMQNMLLSQMYAPAVQTTQPEWVTDYLSPALKGLQGLGSLANIYMGFQNLGLAKDYLGMAKDQWSQTKQEMDRIRNVRKKLSKQYMS